MTDMQSAKERSKEQFLLQELLQKTLCDYSDFAKRSLSDHGEDFTAHQKACKAALAHLEQLVRVIRLLEIGKAQTMTASEELEALVAEARSVVLSQAEREPADDKPGDGQGA